METIKKSSSLVYKGNGRKLIVKKSIDERIIDGYMAVYGKSKREAVQMWKELNMRIELKKVGRELI